MGAMMGTGMGQGGWLLFWIFLGVAVAATALIARAARGQHRSEPAKVQPSESPAVLEARDAMRLRYSRGEISREEYLQGKVELED